MISECHVFVDGDAGRCGAILRHTEPQRMRTRTVFKMAPQDAPVYLVDHVVEHDGDVRHWRRFAYDSPTSGSQHSGEREPDGTVCVDGTSTPALFSAIGGYSEHLVLKQLLVDGEEAISYLQFDESDPADGVQVAELRKQGIESTELLDGSVVNAEVIRLVVAGRETNAHWCIDGLVVKSDWCGAQSFLVDDVDALSAGLDPEVAALIQEFTRP